MRTTIRLDDELLVAVKELALLTGRTLTAVIEDSLRETLSRRRREAGQPKARLTTVGGNGLLPGVDLDDSAALLDVMDQQNASHRR
ncbi:MAG: DUF2191 domain-containing protein [SAR202 cluster bacterium Io17-Chloro-G9]|nr:MAG: DUF2191 domain-containing protein [SAR202 cluster bacterium Io17-Chloro-G9]